MQWKKLGNSQYVTFQFKAWLFFFFTKSCHRRLTNAYNFKWQNNCSLSCKQVSVCFSSHLLGGNESKLHTRKTSNFLFLFLHWSLFLSSPGSWASETFTSALLRLKGGNKCLSNLHFVSSKSLSALTFCMVMARLAFLTTEKRETFLFSARGMVAAIQNLVCGGRGRRS